jgi:glycosyltransferase involved in cell wall biosynthesis
VKIAVYTIALNEEKFVERWYESSKDADYHLILDTGSSDKTVAKAKKLGINVVVASVSPWRFDVARNTALALLPNDIDMCIAMDMDEVLVDGWREELEKIEPGVTRPRHTFTFSFNPDGSPAFQFGGNRVHARQGYIWKYPIHEILMPYNINEVQSWVNLEMQHHPDASKSRDQYFPMLEAASREDPEDARIAFYYGRELYYRRMYKEAAEQLNYFLQLPSATWVGDRSDALIIISRCTNDLVEARQWAWMAIQEAPDRREGYVRMATICYHTENYEEGLMYAERALAITERPLQYMCEDWAWDWQVLDVAAICAWVLGDVDKARKYGIEALEMNPEHERLKKNVEYYLG